MTIFRENTEDIYAGLEWPAGSPENRKLMAFLENELGVPRFRHPGSTGLGVKPVSEPGSQRLVRMAIRYAIDNDRASVTLVHKGNIMKFTEGAFREWGYAVAREEFGAQLLDGGPWLSLTNPRTGREIVIKDVIADNFLQQILLAPQNYDVVATLNLNGDYISDALAAEVGGIGIAPGANIGNGPAVFEATHGTAPDIAGQDSANPGSLLLSAEMMLRYLGWDEAADYVMMGVSKSIENRKMTRDLAVVREVSGAGGTVERMLPGAEVLGSRAFGDAVIACMEA